MRGETRLIAWCGVIGRAHSQAYCGASSVKEEIVDAGVSGDASTYAPAPKRVGRDKNNTAAVILSGEGRLRRVGLVQDGTCSVSRFSRAIVDNVVTVEFHRLMDGTTELQCNGVGEAAIERM
jgi:isocitrate dehydrogenase